MTASSSQRPATAGPGTSVSWRRRDDRCSRPMSCAEPSRLPERRAPQRPAAARRRRRPRRSGSSGRRRCARRRAAARRPSTLAVEPGLDARAVDALRDRVGSLLAHAREAYGRERSTHGPGRRLRRRADDRASGRRSPRSARRRASSPTTVRDLFRSDPEALAPAAPARDGRDRHRRVRARLRRAARDRATTSELTERLFGGARARRGDDRAVRGAARRGHPHRADLELLGAGDLRPRADRPLRRGRDLGRGRPAQAAARDLPARLRAPRGRAGARRCSSTTCARTAPARRRSG